jgi:hypothetical protein
MIAGATAVTVAAFAAFAAIVAVRHWGAIRGSVLLWCVWGVAPEGAYFAVVR